MEYEEVLGRPRLKLTSSAAAKALAAIRESALLVHPTNPLNESIDESDNRFYECAAAADADYIVTGNYKHFTKGYRLTRSSTPVNCSGFCGKRNGPGILWNSSQPTAPRS